MKKLSTTLMALCIMAFSSCVNNNYNLDDLNDDNAGLGDENTIVKAPIGDIVIALDDIIVDFNSRAVKEYTLIDQNVESVIELGEGWLGEEITNTLTSGGGTVSVTASTNEYPVGVPEITLSVWFDDISLFDGTKTINSDNHKVTTDELSTETVTEIANSTNLRYKLFFAEKTFSCDLDDIENLTIKMSITKTGPIKF